LGRFLNPIQNEMGAVKISDEPATRICQGTSRDAFVALTPNVINNPITNPAAGHSIHRTLIGIMVRRLSSDRLANV
jgi:hypothetical protein